MKTTLASVAVVLGLIASGVLVEAAIPIPDPFPAPNGWIESGLSRTYVNTPISFNFGMSEKPDASVTMILHAFVLDLPPGLSASIYAVRPHDYCLQGDGFPGDPRTYHARELIPLSAVRISHGGYAEFILVLTAHRLGTFHTGNIAVDWSSEGYTGESQDPFRITLHVNETGRDPELTGPYNPFGPNPRACVA